MKVCVEWWTALSAYVDDSLTPDERQRVEAHLEECEVCRRVLTELKTLRQSVSLLPRYEPPPMLKARILSATVDQPTWSERLATGWHRWAWRVSLAGAVAVLALFAWQFLPWQVSRSVGNLVSAVTEIPTASRTERVQKALPPSAPKVATVQSKSVQVAKRPPVRSSRPASKPPSPKPEVKWSVVTRVPLSPKPASPDALQGEPMVQGDVPYIDVNSPPVGEQVATQPGEVESKTVATRFALPAEMLSQGTSGLDALREQIRVRNREQWSGEIQRKLQRKQMDVDVITVRF